MRRLLKLIGILLGVLSLYTTLALDINEIPFVDVQLRPNGTDTQLANDEQHENSFPVKSPFLLNCSYIISSGRYNFNYWSVDSVAFYLNQNPLGEFKKINNNFRWENSAQQNRKWDLNVFIHSTDYDNFKSVWIQPLSAKQASGNYSCSVWVNKANENEPKYMSNLFPIEVKDVV